MTSIQFEDEFDQEERITKLRQEIEKHGGIVPEFDLSPDDEEQALREILVGAEDGEFPEICLSDLLTHASVGLKIPPPDQLDNNTLAQKLKEIIDRMASLKAYLLYTNHFSDSQLYEYLYVDVLPFRSALLSMNCAVEHELRFRDRLHRLCCRRLHRASMLSHVLR